MSRWRWGTGRSSSAPGRRISQRESVIRRASVSLACRSEAGAAVIPIRASHDKLDRDFFNRKAYAREALIASSTFSGETAPCGFARQSHRRSRSAMAAAAQVIVHSPAPICSTSGTLFGTEIISGTQLPYPRSRRQSWPCVRHGSGTTVEVVENGEPRHSTPPSLAGLAFGQCCSSMRR